MSRLLVTFPGSSAAMEAELLAEDRGLAVRLIPLPTTLSAGCGLALLADLHLQADVCSLLAEKHIPFEGIFHQQGQQWLPQAP